MMDAGLSDAIRGAGFEPPASIEPGRVARFATNGKTSDRSGWCYLFPDGEGAVFGCWRSGESHTWQSKRDRPLSRAERAEFRRKAEQAKQHATEQREADYREVAQCARAIWDTARPAPPSHAYLVKKGIGPEGLRLCTEGDYRGWLIAPVYGPEGSIQSLQYIAHDGAKRFLSGGKMKAGNVWLSRPENAATAVLLAEGWATGASLHEATGLAVCVGFCAGNLGDVARMIRGQYPAVPLLICGDDDTETPGNPGRTKAAEAAQAVGAGVVFPSGGGDFNDMAQRQGLHTVKALILETLQDAGSAVPQESALAFSAPSLPGADARDGTPGTRPLTELGNAERLLDAHAGSVHFIPEAKAWLVWNGGAWAWDVDGAAVRRLACALPAKIYAEGAAHLNDAGYFARWARASQKERAIHATVALLADAERVRLPLALVDADPWLAGLDGARQMLDLKTGKARPAQQADFVTKTLNVSELGNPSKAVRWGEFLRQIFSGDDALIDWLRRWCGYLLTGRTSEQIFIFCFGLGANGKSVLAETLRHVMGDYARAISSETLTDTKRQAGSATPDLAALIGARLAMSSETEDGAALAESLIKSLVAGDAMSVRQLYGAPFQFLPQFKLLMLGNHKPVIRGNDYGIWRRVRLIPFRRTFTEHERDPALLETLKAESPHILAWMVEGCTDWQRRGLADVPAAIRQATGEYQQEQDIVGRWLAETCRFVSDAETSATELYANYKGWALDNGLKPASSVSLGRRLAERGFSVRQSSGRRLWAGLALNSRW